MPDKPGTDAGFLETAARTLASAFRYVSEARARHWLYSTGYDVGEVSDKIRRKYAPYEA